MPQKTPVYNLDSARYDRRHMFGLKKNSHVTDHSQIARALERRLEPTGIFPNKDEAVKILAIKPLRVYLGIDPTGPDIHLGHSIPLLFLKQLWYLGHTPVIVIGDFTARIGDPTGKSTTRKPLSPEDIKQNSQNYTKQIEKILPKGSFEVLHNNDWLGKLSFADILRLSSQVTVQQMIQRDMFQDRIKNEQPIGLHEFLYPLMQGYDSVAMEIDGEVGGNDQTFNMLMGRDLEKKLLQKEKLVFATKLLVGPSGKKMSKSEGAIVAVTDSPADIYGKTMSGIPDEMIQAVFEMCTEKDLLWITEHVADMQANPYQYKKELGRELVAMYYDADTAVEAEAEFNKVFSGKQLPTDMMEIEGAGSSVVAAIVGAGLAMSNSEAKRLIDQKAVHVNESVVSSWDELLKSGDIIQVGPRKFAKVK